MSYPPRNDYSAHRRTPVRRRRRRTPLIVKLLAFVGLITLLVVLGKFVVVPLLVYLNAAGVTL